MKAMTIKRLSIMLQGMSPLTAPSGYRQSAERCPLSGESGQLTSRANQLRFVSTCPSHLESKFATL